MPHGTDGRSSENTPLLVGSRGPAERFGEDESARLQREESFKPAHMKHGKYSVRYITSICSLFEFRGTAFASWSIWLHVLAYVLFSGAVGVLVFFSCRRPELIDTRRLAEPVVYSSFILGFMLVFHLSVALRRWWSLRLDTLGGLTAAVGDLTMLLATHFPQESCSELKALVRRYCLASLELTFMQAQGTDGVLGGLVSHKLLTDDEKRKLEELVSKPQAMWVWIAGIFQRLAERGKLSSRLLNHLYGICSRGRAAVGRGQGAFAYLDTQVPFAYVHFLSVMVHLNSLAIAGKCGVVSAVALWNLQRSEEKGPISDMENAQVLLIQIVLVMGIPALYHAVLEEVAHLSDPFGDKPRDFQRRACHEAMRRECEALQMAGEQPPLEALQVTEEFEVREGDLVHDVIVLKAAQQSLLESA
mmetsp:Transcript_165523/g.531169  ORF Transcript_165523/g.531169 Transcript_165523/m.531169 type:complete len:417 (+) Transcript_165523:154-1404(+)|eukprot:CAMPEP_0203860576 /NCGR_PEP_ID=MMETSP0359-20131031/12503_1 /ASSEMBLY_ACC=CAM_ASM_000338 /TAXON_ID=268821 /ORGANISM="Scrippsiella Hangoei, Strain SHTV-5" /LENGTH=416 /DNA_ID=CAMNT_0050777671 /DNA_START=149 /DNA_END=1399 /DNA_ORIENTATION=+